MRRDADWNDWRYFLAVARSGSTLAAAKEMRVSQTTVARRVAALEGALGVPLFERRPAGYALTPAGEALISDAEAIEQSALRTEQLALSQGRDASGTVRITSEDIFVIGLLSDHIGPLQERYPDVRIEFDTTSGLRDLGAGEADIAFRSTSKDQPAGIVGRVICIDDWTLYCSRSYAERHGIPTSVPDLKNHAIIGGGGGQLAREYGAWLESEGLSDRVTIQQSSATGLLSAARGGLGIAVLPCIIADAEPDLIQCAPPLQNESRRLWLVTHERIRHRPAVRAVIDFLYDRLTGHVRTLQEQRRRPRAA